MRNKFLIFVQETEKKTRVEREENIWRTENNGNVGEHDNDQASEYSVICVFECQKKWMAGLVRVDSYANASAHS